MNSVAASAPARVDLAGGTLDLWPLYLLHPGSKTVNVAIDRRARAAVTRIGRGFEFFSRDLGFERRFEDAESARGVRESAMAAEAALALGFRSGLRIETSSSVPFGSGLGGSSALLVATVCALWRIRSEAPGPERVREVCRDAETRLLGAPAGIQDYDSAIRGGLNILNFEVGGPIVESCPAPIEEFSRHLLLFDTGRPHSSGLNNWEIYKARIDGDAAVARALDGIRDCAAALAEAARVFDFPAMGAALGREWGHRKRLSRNVSSEILEDAERRARGAGAWGVKACGAGGGGVLAILAPLERRAAVLEALGEMREGAVLEARPENEGVRFEI